MKRNNSRPDPVQKALNLTSDSQTTSQSSHQVAHPASWWLDFWTMSGRKSQNQDSLLSTTCLAGYLDATNQIATLSTTPSTAKTLPAKTLSSTIDPQYLPILTVLADGVSACQFPKQASRLAVEIFSESVIDGLWGIYEQTQTHAAQFNLQAYKAIFDDESVAGVIKLAVTKANDSMYFSQTYQRVAPLLSTLSGVLCIGDRVYLFHTGDSRVYRVGAQSLTVLTEDHRIHHGQDKGALSAALGADTRVDLQQSVFTLHQNEYLALMTDGVYEFIDPVEMQFEFSAAVTHLENTPNWNDLSHWNLSYQLCQLALAEGSNDNLSIMMIGMGSLHQSKRSSTSIGNGSTHHLSKIGITMTANRGATQTQDTNTDGLDQKGLDKEGSNLSSTSVGTAPDQAAVSNTTQVAKSDLVEGDMISPSRYQLPIGLQEGDEIDGFTVVRIIARTARSEVYLVHDVAERPYVLKSPSMMTVDDGNYLRDFLKERKIGLSLSKHRRAGESAYNQTNPNHTTSLNINSESATHSAPEGASLSETGLLRYYPVPATSNYLYHLTEFIDGESLRMFMDRNGPCDVWQTHDLLTKIGMAVRVMHRNYLLHQDIKPENVLLTKTGAVKLIDFGSTASSILKDNTRPPVGDLHYAAPEYYTDAPKGVHSDLFSIAVIGFELLTGERPFTSQMLMSPTDPLVVSTELLRQNQVPATSQQALLRALHRNTNARHQAMGEFLQDFNPDNMASSADPEPLIKRNPLLVWHGICFIQFIIIVLLLVKFLPTL